MNTNPAAPGTVTEFAQRIAAVKESIESACERAGRDCAEVRLLPVSKTVPAETLRQAVAAGALRLGENKVQEAHSKWQSLVDTPAQWAVIGHLQTNKAKLVAEFASEFQALDSQKVAAVLDKHLQQRERSLDVFVQVNTSGEESKYGADPAAVPALLEVLADYPRLRVRGFMTLAINSIDETAVRSCFAKLRNIRDAAVRDFGDVLSAAELSMGMSGDYELAIAEGSNCVRIGSAIFGKRQPQKLQS